MGGQLNHARFLRGADAWDMDQQLEVEDGDEAEVSVSPGGSPESPSSQPQAKTQNNRGYYEDLIRAAIEGGGRLGGYEIRMKWLKVTLAGLEGRDASLEETQDTYQSEDEASHPGREESASASLGQPGLIESQPLENPY